MLDSVLAPYLLWAKSRQPAAIDLAGSNLLHCTIDELPGVRDAVDVSAPNDNGYAPLVDAIARHYGVAPDRVVTAAGCSGANFIAIAALVGAGDDVLIERPGYDPLIGAARLMGAQINRFDRRLDQNWALDLDAIRERLTPRTRLIIVTTPHNPSGVALDRASLVALGELAEREGVHVLVDEVYLDGTNLVRAGAPRVPAATLDGPFLSTSSLTKSYGLAGLRCGWIVAPPRIAERLRRTRDVIDNAGSAPADRLGALAFSQLPGLSERTRRVLGGNIARARAFFAAHPQLEIAEPPSASVVFPRLRGVDDSSAFVTRLLMEHGVAVAPGHFFEAPAHFRLSLAGGSEALAQGLELLGSDLALI
jgi:aspartate/methionine/tyrosine aminotransferase